MESAFAKVRALTSASQRQHRRHEMSARRSREVHVLFVETLISLGKFGKLGGAIGKMAHLLPKLALYHRRDGNWTEKHRTERADYLYPRELTRIVEKNKERKNKTKKIQPI
jgi:hypothetical protein